MLLQRRNQPFPLWPYEWTRFITTVSNPDLLIAIHTQSHQTPSGLLVCNCNTQTARFHLWPHSQPIWNCHPTHPPIMSHLHTKHLLPLTLLFHIPLPEALMLFHQSYLQQTLDYPCAVYSVCGSSVQHPGLFYFCRPIEILNTCEPSLEFQIPRLKSDLGNFVSSKGAVLCYVHWSAARSMKIES